MSLKFPILSSEVGQSVASSSASLTVRNLDRLRAGCLQACCRAATASPCVLRLRRVRATPTRPASTTCASQRWKTTASAAPSAPTSPPAPPGPASLVSPQNRRFGATWRAPPAWPIVMLLAGGDASVRSCYLKSVLALDPSQGATAYNWQPRGMAMYPLHQELRYTGGVPIMFESGTKDRPYPDYVYGCPYPPSADGTCQVRFVSSLLGCCRKHVAKSGVASACRRQPLNEGQGEWRGGGASF